MLLPLCRHCHNCEEARSCAPCCANPALGGINRFLKFYCPLRFSSVSCCLMPIACVSTHIPTSGENWNDDERNPLAKPLTHCRSSLHPLLCSAPQAICIFTAKNGVVSVLSQSLNSSCISLIPPSLSRRRLHLPHPFQ